MSTLQATNLKHGSSASNNLVLDANGNVTAAGTVAMATPFGMRNKIINGAMEIDQRNAGASITPIVNFVYSVDRWQCGLTQSSKYSIQQNAGAVTPPAGFINYLGVTSLSAYSVTSSDVFFIRQSVEGLNCADLAWGTANAKAVTLSFWVRSSLTGIFGGTLKNSAGDRSYPFTYTISSANTWEYKTISIPGDTSGVWLTTNGIGIALTIALGGGTAQSGPAGAWAGVNYNSATGATSVVATNGATFYLTGVQLEVGSVATPFERRLYTTELQLAQRYYAKTYSVETSPATATTAGYVITTCTNSGWSYVTWKLPISMRVAPTVTLYNHSTGAIGTWQTGAGTTVTPTILSASTENIPLGTTAAPANSYMVGHIVASAEL